MALAINHLATGTDGTSGGSSLTAGTFTPTANAKIYVFCYSSDFGNGGTHDHTVTGGGLTWTREEHCPQNSWNGDANFGGRGSLHSATAPSSPSAISNCAFAVGAGEPSYHSMQVFEVTGASTVVQSDNAGDQDGGGASETLTVTMTQAATNGNLVFCCFGAAGDNIGACATPSGFTALGTPQTQQYTHVGVYSRTDFTGSSVQCTDLGETVGHSGGVVVELAEAITATLDQEGFRVRNDDGSETTATWRAAQDTNSNIALATNVRLRMLVDTVDDYPSFAPTLRYKKSTDGTYLAVPTSGAAPQDEVTWVTEQNAAITTSRSPSVTFPSNAQTDDIVYFYCSTTAAAAITTPAGWVNPLSGNTVVASDSHQACAVYHIVTSGENGTATFTCTNLFNATTTGNVLAGLLRNVDTSSVVDNAGSTFNSGNTITPHVLASITGTGSALVGSSMVVRGVSKDGTGTYTTPASHTQRTTSNTNQGSWLGTRDALTTANTDVAAVNITPSAGDEYASISVAFTREPAGTAPPVFISASANITAGGEATTAQLSAPSGKTTSDFTTGRMWDNENGTDTVDVATDFYTELEWSVQFQSPAVDTDIYQFRVYAGSNALDTYTVTPEITIGAGSPDGTATPAVIARSVALPAPTAQAGTVTAPAVIARAVTLPAPTVAGGSGASPAVIARAVALPAPTLQFGWTATPTVIARAVTLPAPTATGGGSATATPAVTPLAAVLPAPTTQAGSRASPAVIARAVVLPAATGSGSKTALPAVIPLAVFFDTANVDSSAGVDVIPLAVTIPQAAATGGGSATALPAVIARTVVLPAPTLSYGSTLAPAVIPLAAALPAATTQGGVASSPAVIPLAAVLSAATVSGGGNTAPAVIALAAVLPPASASGANPGTGAPAVISLAAVLPQVSPMFGWAATPAVIPLAAVLPAATGQASKTAAPVVIARAVVLPAPTASGGTSTTAQPGSIVLAVTLPAPTMLYGSTFTPATITLAVVMPPGVPFFEAIPGVAVTAAYIAGVVATAEAATVTASAELVEVTV